MFSINALLFFIILLLIASLLEPLAKKTFIPFSIILVLVGYIGAQITINLFGIDTGIRWDNFKPIIFYILLPILIFRSAIEIDIRELIKESVPIFVMVLPLMILSTLVVAISLYQGIGHPTGFPWIAALITGALLSATDPAAIISFLKDTNKTKRLRILLESESLFNDATAIVLFSILIAIAIDYQEAITWHSLLGQFFLIFVGSVAVGAMVGVITNWAVRLIDRPKSFALIGILSAYAVFIFVEDILHCSGVIAVLTYSIVLAPLCSSALDKHDFANQFWQLCANIAESMIFLLAGLTITLDMFLDQWLAICIGIMAVFFTRVAMVFGFLPFLTLIPNIEPISLKQQTILVWGGIRGTVTLALVLSLPLTLDYWYTIQSVAYGVVIFGLFFQTITMPLILKWLR